MTERVGVIGRIRKLAVGVAEAWVDQLGMRREPRFPGAARMNLLLEIGAEEIPDWMLAGALEYLGSAVGDLLKEHQLGDPSIRTDATPRRLVVRAEGVIARQPDSEERVWGPAKVRASRGRRGFREKTGPGARINWKSSPMAKRRNTAACARSRAEPPARFSPKLCHNSFSKRRSRRACTGPEKAACVSSAPSAGSSRFLTIR